MFAVADIQRTTMTLAEDLDTACILLEHRSKENKYDVWYCRNDTKAISTSCPIMAAYKDGYIYLCLVKPQSKHNIRKPTKFERIRI